MFRLLCLILTVGLVCGLSTLQKRDWSNFDIDGPAVLHCNTGRVHVAHVVLLLQNDSPQCEEYSRNPGQVTDMLRSFCVEHGPPEICVFLLADVIGHAPDPSCFTSYDVIYMCI